ncbi:hypothetical protein AK812_SmicGene9151 [Symbiodinium microadriaticum]|uniref:Uncharacterized protein n=1 Tax=Symbiodinium microadriaticum TaxID=2951 RepID=A0A1Q9EJA4_SYMMI|nr:hypothetical protein AK812_SmicGene9151 [Symbiodinium microadriaticum]
MKSARLYAALLHSRSDGAGTLCPKRLNRRGQIAGHEEKGVYFKAVVQAVRRELELDRLGLPPPPKAPPIAAPPMGVALLKTRAHPDSLVQTVGEKRRKDQRLRKKFVPWMYLV